MDGYSGKRAGDGLLVSRKPSSHILNDNANSKDRNGQFCNRIGCSGRLNSTKVGQTSCSEKTKSSRTSIRSSSSGKGIIGSSSRSCPSIGNHRKPLTESRKKLSEKIETDSSEAGSIQGEPEVLELTPPPGKIQRGLQAESDCAGSNGITSRDVGGSSLPKNTRSHRSFYQKSGLGNNTSVGGSPASLASKGTSPGTRANTSRSGFRNLSCNSVSDIVKSNSSSDSNVSRKKDTVKKRIIYEGESSSSARGKKINGSSLGTRSSTTSPGISISDSRRARSGLPNRDNGAASVRTGSLLNVYSRESTSNQGNRNNVSPNESHAGIPHMSLPDISTDLNVSSSLHQFSVESSLSHPSSFVRPGSSSGSFRGIRPSSPSDFAHTRSLINHESLRRYNLDGIAEVLLALERIEQDEELTYEQLLVLETNLFFNGMNFYDQHRDMRLDIDNMSYEELLALEERMGTVSTALTEEALSECIKSSAYQSASLEDASSNVCEDEDDIKCSICQEEYVDGDEVGSLQCEHRYHLVCIHQWLRLKNWCPICKGSAAVSLSPLEPSSSSQLVQ